MFALLLKTKRAPLPKTIQNEAYRELITRLVDARTKAGLTQQAVADLLGKPQSYVAKVEGLERRLDVIEFLTMAGAIGFDPMPAMKSAWREVRASSE